MADTGDDVAADDLPQGQSAAFDYRPVVHSDMIMLSRWLREPAVSAWWRDGVAQLARIQHRLSDPTIDQLIVHADGQPIAYVQVYDLAQWPADHMADHMAGLMDGTLGIDCFAAPDGMGQGGAWLADLASRLLANAPMLAVDPEFGNGRAIAAFGKAGFSGTMLRVNAEGRQLRIMTRQR